MALQPTHQTLSNGIESFSNASPDYELAPVGIASMQNQAKKLAEYGRNGDIYVIHAAEGETVIPMEVLNANPQIKQLLFAQMEDMGLDPQEFVVGNELNSINPVTGLPEFFFKSIFRAVKKAVKKVFKIAKKIAPIALPIAIGTFGLPFLPAGSSLATLFGPGTAASAALGSGLGTLAGGGNLKDTFKSALLSGGIATLGGGLARGFQAKPGQFGTEFMKGAGQTLTGTDAPLGEYLQKGKDYLLSGDPTSTGFSASGDPTSTGLSASGDATTLKTVNASNPGYKVVFDRPSLEEVGVLQDAVLKAQKNQGGIMQTIFGPQEPTAAQVLTELKGMTNNPVAQNLLKKPLGDSFTKLISESGAGPLRTYGPLAAAGLGAGALGGMFDAPEEEEVTTADLQFGLESGALQPNVLFEEDPDKFKIPVDPFRFQTASNPFVPTRFAADGGMIRGPGTGTSDSIPGWLSDGEFVLTEKAVRGADPTGQGRREAGADNLYNIMRNFEMRA